MKNHHQTPQKEQQHSRSLEPANRRSKEPSLKSISEQAKKPHKITKKSLNAAFTSVSEDLFSQTTNESLDFSSVSDGSDGVQFTESFQASLNPALAASSETSTLSDLTPSSKITTDKDEGGDVSVLRYGSCESDRVNTRSLEADIIADHLKQARFQVMNSANMNRRSQKFLDALNKMVAEDFYGSPEERDESSELLMARIGAVFLGFLLWIFCLSVGFFYRSVGESSSHEPPPT